MNLLFEGCSDAVLRKHRTFVDLCSMKVNGMMTRKAYDCILYDKGSIDECVIFEDAERLRNYGVLHSLPKYVCCLSDETFPHINRIRSNLAVLCKSTEKAEQIATYISNHFGDRNIVSVIGTMVRVNEKKEVRELVYGFLQTSLPMDIVHTIFQMAHVQPTQPTPNPQTTHVRHPMDRERERDHRRRFRDRAARDREVMVPTNPPSS